ncbi:MAG: hypothetical protein AABW85_01890 [archaeon]
MPAFLDVFFQKKTAADIVRARPTLSKSFSWFIAALGVFLAARTIGTFFEQVIFVLLGWQGMFGAFFSTATFFAAFVILAIPAIIVLSVLLFFYFIAAKIFGGRAMDFFQFLSDSFVLFSSLVVVMGLVSLLPFIHYLVNFFVLVYGIYLFIRLVEEYFFVSFFRAFFVWFAPSLLVFCALAVIAIIFAGIFFVFF